MKILNIIVMAVVFCSSGLFAQPPLMGGGKLDRAQMRKRFETIKIWRMTEAVDLSTEQSEKFFPLYKTLNDELGDIEKSRNETMRELGQKSDSDDASESDLDKLLKRMNDLRTQEFAARDKFLKDAESILSKKQIAKLVVFEEHFRREIRETLQEIRRHEGPGRGRMRDQPR